MGARPKIFVCQLYRWNTLVHTVSQMNRYPMLTYPYFLHFLG